MKRTDISNIFPEATEEQIKTLMDLNGADVNAAKKNTEELKAQLTKAKADLLDLQTKAPQLQTALDRASELETELAALKQAEQLRTLRDNVAKETGVPAGLLTGETEDACKQQAETLKQWRDSKPRYPDTGDGGSPMGGNAAGASTRDLFAEWFDSALSQL